MKKSLFLRVFALLAFTVLFSGISSAQDKSKRPSPPDSAQGKIGNAAITIRYSSPSVKGRQIWGSLVPYDKAWRAGANEATIFETDKEIKVEGKSLPAGKYSLFAVPGEKEWTIIFNSETGQWGIKRTGEANFDPAKNVVSVTVKPVKSAKNFERLTYQVTKKGFVLLWDNLEVPVSVKD